MVQNGWNLKTQSSRGLYIGIHYQTQGRGRPYEEIYWRPGASRGFRPRRDTTMNSTEVGHTDSIGLGKEWLVEYSDPILEGGVF